MGLGNQPFAFSKRFLLGALGVGALLAVLVAGYYYFVPGGNSFSLNKEVKDNYTEALLLSYREKEPAQAIEKLDGELKRIGGIASKTEADLYTEAKLKIYKGDLLIGGGDLKGGAALLSGVYADASYDLSTRNEAFLIALSRSLQGLGEGFFDSREIESVVFRDPALGVSATTTLSMDAPEPIRIYFAFIAGFSKVLSDTASPKSYLLAESYLLRLYAQVIEYTQGVNERQGLLSSDMEQFESDLSLLKPQLEASDQFEEFYVTSLYNLALAHEFLAREAEGARIENITRIRDLLASYRSYFPDDSYRIRPFEDGLGLRLVCRIVNQAKFDAAAINKTQLKTLLDPLFQTASLQGALPVPCESQFAFIAQKIDTRFAPYIPK